MKLEGLPEGLEVVRWGVAASDEWIACGDAAMRGRGYDQPALVVKPAPGYSIEFDIRQNRTVVSRKWQRPERVALLLETEQHRALLEEFLKQVPGIVTEDAEVIA